MAAVGEHADARGTAVTDICAHVAHLVVGLLEPVDEGGVHLGEGRVDGEVVLRKLYLQVALDEHGQAMLEEGADVAPVRAVPVAHREEVAVLEAHDVGVGDVGVLVDFVRVVRRNAALGREGELRDNIHDFLGLRARLAFVSLLALA